MALFRRKKKAKKPFTADTLVKILMPILVLGLIIYCGYTTLRGFGDVTGEYKELVAELSKEIDKDLLLTDNAIIASDRTTMTEKIKAAGLDELLINEEVSGNIYNNSSVLNMTSSLGMTDCEWGALAEVVLNYTNYRGGLTLLELSITKTVSGKYKIYAVGKFDVTDVTKEIKGLESITELYVSSNAYIEADAGEIKYTDCTSRVNMLDDEHNNEICTILNASYLAGTDEAVLIPQITQFLSDFAAKTMSTPDLDLHKILMIIQG